MWLAVMGFPTIIGRKGKVKTGDTVSIDVHRVLHRYTSPEGQSRWDKVNDNTSWNAAGKGQTAA